MKFYSCRKYFRNAHVFILIFLLIAPVFAISDEQTTEKFEAAVKAKLEAFVKENSLPGAVAAFVLKDGSYAAVPAGVSDIENQTPLKITDRLLSGSIGKTYFAAVVMQLVAEKKLNLDAKISKWLAKEPWFKRLPNGPGITVRMLMNHTSGIPEHVRVPEFGAAVGDDPDRVWEHHELLEYILGSEPKFEAGQGWSYADTNYIVLGIILEKITGTALYDELKERVLKPLKLNDTVPSNNRVIPHLIPGYAGEFNPFKKPGKSIIDGKLVINPQVEWTGGGLACTTLDLARWGWLVYQGKAFPMELMDQVLEGPRAQTGPQDRYGLGVIIWPGKHGTCWGHSGWFPGYISQMAFYVDHKISIALQINTDMLPGASGKMREMVDEIAGILTQ